MLLPDAPRVASPLAIGVAGIVLGALAVLLPAAPFGTLLGWPLALLATLIGILALCPPRRPILVGAAAVALGVRSVPVGLVVPLVLPL